MSEVRAQGALVDPSLRRTWGQGTSRNFRAEWPAMAEAKGKGGLSRAGRESRMPGQGNGCLLLCVPGRDSKGDL